MATQKLTKRAIDSLTPRARTYIVYDDNLPGFGCRVTPNGSRSWIVEYRPHGGGRAVAKKRITLAPISVLTPDQARETAGDILASVRLGHDVAPDRAARRSSPLVTALVERFMSEEVRPTRKPTTVALYDMYFRRYILPELGQKRAREVVLADVAKLHRKIGATKPVTANRVLELISGLYTWAARIGEVPKDLRPAHGVTRYREQGRERFLSSAELARLGAALREAETIGVPWVIDKSNPKSKHAPKRNRRTKISPFATQPFGCCYLPAVVCVKSSTCVGRNSTANGECCSCQTARPAESR